MEADGRVFPQSDRSQSIEQCLLDTAKSLGVEIAVNCDVQSVRRVTGGDGEEDGERCIQWINHAENSRAEHIGSLSSNRGLFCFPSLP